MARDTERYRSRKWNFKDSESVTWEEDGVNILAHADATIGALKNHTEQGNIEPTGSAGGSSTPDSTNTSTDIVTDSGNSFSTGSRVTVASTGGGLTAGTPYYLHLWTASTYSFHLTPEDAFRGDNKVDLTSSITAVVTGDAISGLNVPLTARQPCQVTVRNEGQNGNWLIGFRGLIPVPPDVYSIKIGPGEEILLFQGESFTEVEPPYGDVCFIHDDPGAPLARRCHFYASWFDGTLPTASPAGITRWFTPTPTPDGVTTVFTISVNGDVDSVQVIQNGVTLTPGVDFTVAAGSIIITFAVAPLVGDKILVGLQLDGTGSDAFTAGKGYAATSADSRTITAITSVTFQVEARLAYTQGARIRATAIPDGSWMEGVVTSYVDSGTFGTLVVMMDLANGSGTFSDWNINLAGEPQINHRNDVPVTTASLAHLAEELGDFELGKSSMVYRVLASDFCRIRLYSYSDGRDNDQARPYDQKAPWNSGLQLELLLNALDILDFRMQPNALVVNEDDISPPSSPTNTIYYTIQNLSGATTALDVTFSRIQLESALP